MEQNKCYTVYTVKSCPCYLCIWTSQLSKSILSGNLGFNLYIAVPLELVVMGKNGKDFKWYAYVHYKQKGKTYKVMRWQSLFKCGYMHNNDESVLECVFDFWSSMLLMRMCVSFWMGVCMLACRLPGFYVHKCIMYKSNLKMWYKT